MITITDIWTWPHNVLLRANVRSNHVLKVSFLHLAEDEREVGIPETMHYDAPVRYTASILGGGTASLRAVDCCVLHRLHVRYTKTRSIRMALGRQLM